MSESEFLEYVQRVADPESSERAGGVAEATLREFGRRMSRGEADDLGAHLPPRFGRALGDVDRMAEPDTLDSFLGDVAERADLAGDVRGTVQGVFVAVAEYAGADELSNAASQLPPEYGEVVEPGDVDVPSSFVDAVRDRSDRGQDADVAAEATLAVLGRRLSRGEAEDLASYLHGEADGWLLERAGDDPETLSTVEFVEQVAARAEVSEDVAREYVRDVTATLSEEVPDRELGRALDQLPDDYQGLFALEVESRPT